MGTFSKSLASLGGYMASKAVVVDYTRHNSRPFMFSASMPPATAAVALAALKHLEAHPELPKNLIKISNYFRNCLTERGIKIRQSETPIVPIYTYDPIPTLTISKELYEQGVYVNSTLPPATAPGECLLRTSLMASHTEALCDEAADIIQKVLKEHEII